MINYKRSHPNWVPYGIFGTLLILIILQISTNRKIDAKLQAERYAYIQNPVEGTTTTAEAVDSKKVTPQNVMTFLIDWKKNTYTWSGLLPNGNPDRGATVNGNIVPTAFQKGMEFVVPPGRYTFIDQTAALFKASLPLSGFTSRGDYTSKIENNIAVDNLKESAPGVWQANVFSTQTITPRRGDKVAFVFKNELLTLQVVPPPSDTSWEPKESSFSETFNAMKKQRLMIIEISEVKDSQK
jgi:hypothetical protein